MAKTLVVKFRPPKKDAKVSPRIYVSSDNLIHLTGALDNGRICTVQVAGDASTRREATLWLDRQLTGVPGPKASPVRSTEAFHEACDLGLTGTYTISSSAATVPDALEVVLEDITSEDVADVMTSVQVGHWTGVLMGWLESEVLPSFFSFFFLHHHYLMIDISSGV